MNFLWSSAPPANQNDPVELVRKFDQSVSWVPQKCCFTHVRVGREPGSHQGWLSVNFINFVKYPWLGHHTNTTQRLFIEIIESYWKWCQSQRMIKKLLSKNVDFFFYIYIYYIFFNIMQINFNFTNCFFSLDDLNCIIMMIMIVYCIVILMFLLLYLLMYSWGSTRIPYVGRIRVEE